MFNWEDFLALAERLVREVDNESSQRTAISRAYYAAYHAAAVYVRTQGLLPTGHTHRNVWAVLAASSNAELAEAGRRGDLLRQLRILADYRSRFPGDIGNQARTAAVRARDVIDTLRRLA